MRSTKHEVRNTEYETRSTEYEVPSTAHTVSIRRGNESRRGSVAQPAPYSVLHFMSDRPLFPIPCSLFPCPAVAAHALQAVQPKTRRWPSLGKRQPRAGSATVLVRFTHRTQLRGLRAADERDEHAEHGGCGGDVKPAGDGHGEQPKPRGSAGVCPVCWASTVVSTAPASPTPSAIPVLRAVASIPAAMP